MQTMQRIPPPIDPGDSRPTTAPCVAAGLTHNSSCSPSQLHSAVRTYKCQIHPGSLLPVMHTFPETSQNQRLPLRCSSVVVWGIGVVARHHRSGSAFGGIVLFYFFLLLFGRIPVLSRVGWAFESGVQRTYIKTEAFRCGEGCANDRPWPELMIPSFMFIRNFARAHTLLRIAPSPAPLTQRRTNKHIDM